MKIKTNVRAGKGGSGGGSSSKSANAVVTYVSALLSQYINRCSGV
jgi:hypothetical protein